MSLLKEFQKGEKLDFVNLCKLLEESQVIHQKDFLVHLFMSQLQKE